MRNDLTHIALIVDKSGSMASCLTDAQGGINAFIEEQKKQPGEARLTFVQFDTNYTIVHKNKPITEVESYVLRPGGCTALLDAVGKTINEVGVELDKTPDAERPGCVVVVIVTDGQENSSVEFTRSQVKEMIERQTNIYNWKFTFLGADASTFAEAGSIGLDPSVIAKYSPHNSAQAYAAVCRNVSNVRCCSMSGDNSASLKYTEEQRSKMS